jgi:hypothetical protein
MTWKKSPKNISSASTEAWEDQTHEETIRPESTSKTPDEIHLEGNNTQLSKVQEKGAWE